MTLTDLMREDVVTATPETATDELARRLRDENVGSVVLVDDDYRPTGIVTDRDLAIEVMASGRDPGEVLAGDVMTPDPMTVPEDTGVLELCDALCDATVRRMPVVADDGTLAGIVTLDDLSVLFAREQGDLADVIISESPPY